MIKTTLVGVASIFYSMSFSQSNVVTSGAEAQGTNGNVSYSIGQIDYISTSNSTGSISQGVQQPYEFYSSVGLDEQSIITSIFPNPTTDIIQVNISQFAGMSYQLIDQNGKIISSNNITSESTEIDMKQLPSAKYHLIILKESQKIESTKIIKH